MDANLAFTPALEQAELIRSKQISPVEIVELYLRRIEAIDPGLGAYITVAADPALYAARRAADAIARGEHSGPFHGVPVAIKDLNDTAGIRTTYASAMFAGHVPEVDEAMVARLKRAGFIVLGKTNTPEFGWSFVTESPAFAAARNPWDTSRTPGGSSGGAGAALAAGLTPIAQGSDAGGSIRVPSSACGVFGIKPSRGRVSAAPWPAKLAWQNGPMARTVADAASMLDVMAGYEWGDPWWAPAPSRPFAQEVDADPGRLRVAFSTGGVAVAPGNRDALQKAAALLAQLGHDVEEADPVPGWAVQGSSELSDAYMGASLADAPMLPPVDQIPLDQLDPANRHIIELGKSLSANDYLALEAQVASAARILVGFFERYDVLLTPTVAKPPIRIGEGRSGSIQDLFAAWTSFAPFTGTWNMTGQPAVSVPFSHDELGLPVGVHLVGRPADEATLIRIASQIEREHPWADRRPPVD